MDTWRTRLSATCGLAVIAIGLVACASMQPAGAKVIPLSNEHGEGQSAEVCRALLPALEHDLHRLAVQGCAWRANLSSEGEVTQPVWAPYSGPIPAGQLVRNLWLFQSGLTAIAQKKDWRDPAYAHAIFTPALNKHIDEGLAADQFLISQARFDVDADGTADDIVRLDVKDCSRPANPARSARLTSDYPIYGILDAKGGLDVRRALPAGTRIFFQWRNAGFALQFSPIESPNHWMAQGVARPDSLALEVESVFRRSDADQERFTYLNAVGVSAPLCFYRADLD